MVKVLVIVLTGEAVIFPKNVLFVKLEFKLPSLISFKFPKISISGIAPIQLDT